MSVRISIEDVVKKFGNDTVIKGLSCEIQPSEFFTLLGPSGCGKTTLLRMIIGFNSIEGGQIKIDDKVINNVPTNKRNMGMVFQNYAIFPHLSVKDNVAFGLKNRKLPKEEIDRKVDKILDVVQISQLRDRMPANMSGGQQQRVALARAIVIEPEVLLMDEPLSNLDAKLRVEMRNAIKEVQRDIGITTVYVTHDQEEALAISDRIAVMNVGVIQQIDTPKNIYQRPANLFVAAFIGLSNILNGVRTKDGIKIDDYEVIMTNLLDTVEEGQPIKTSIRPEEFYVHTDGTPGIKAKIKNSVFLGVNTHYFIVTENGDDLEVIQPSELGTIIPDGADVTLTVDNKKANVYTEDGLTNIVDWR